MKQFMYAFGILSLLLAGTACNNDPWDEEIPNGIKPVTLSGAPGAELTSFFDANLRWITFSVLGEDSPYGGRYLPKADDCVMINSMEEFLAIDVPDYISSVEFPAIDFDAYTLVIGTYRMRDGGIYLAAQRLVVEPEETTVNLLLGKLDGGLHGIWAEPFWGLYPKINASAIRVVTRDI